jgi:hypothetical protein
LDNPDSRARTASHRFLALVAGSILVTITYLLSHAPLYRVIHGRNPVDYGWDDIIHFRKTRTWPVSVEFGFPAGAWEGLQPLYKPVEFAIDDTPLREPLLWWADLSDVRGSLEYESDLRTGRFKPARVGFGCP